MTGSTGGDGESLARWTGGGASGGVGRLARLFRMAATSASHSARLKFRDCQSARRWKA